MDTVVHAGSPSIRSEGKKMRSSSNFSATQGVWDHSGLHEIPSFKSKQQTNKQTKMSVYWAGCDGSCLQSQDTQEGEAGGWWIWVQPRLYSRIPTPKKVRREKQCLVVTQNNRRHYSIVTHMHGVFGSRSQPSPLSGLSEVYSSHPLFFPTLNSAYWVWEKMCCLSSWLQFISSRWPSPVPPTCSQMILFCSLWLRV